MTATEIMDVLRDKNIPYLDNGQIYMLYFRSYHEDVGIYLGGISLHKSLWSVARHIEEAVRNGDMFIEDLDALDEQFNNRPGTWNITVVKEAS